jgi:hypothetical protein
MVIFEVRAKGNPAKETHLGTAVLSGGSATLSVKPNRVQKQVVTIVYSGDADFTSSTETTPRLTQAALRSLARPVMLQKLRPLRFVSKVRGRWS